MWLNVMNVCEMNSDNTFGGECVSMIIASAA